MNQTQDAGQEPTASPYLRLPAAVVALALAGLLAVLLAAGLYANANLRPQGEVLPTPAATPVLAAAPVATATPAVASPTPAAVTATAATPPPAAPSATVVPTVAPTAPPAAATPGPTPLVLNLDATPTGQAPTEQPTPLPTVEPALAAEVGQAYENFWRVRSQASLTLDTSNVADVMDGAYLQHFIDVTNQLQDEHRAIKTQVTLNYMVVQVAGDVAYIHDRIEDNSIYVDPDTGIPTSDPQNDTILIEFKLNKFDGVWKVVDSVIHE